MLELADKDIAVITTIVYRSKKLSSDMENTKEDANLTSRDKNY